MKSGTSPLPSITYLFAAAWALIITALYLLALDSFIGKPDVDSSIYIYVAKGMLEGELPYVDRWDNKGPLFYSLNAIGLLIHETWGLWLVEGLFLFGAAAFTFLALRKCFGIVPACFAIAIFLTLYARFAAPGNFTEQYGILFQGITLYLFLRSQEHSGLSRSQLGFASLHLAIGALGAASFLIRPNLVALWLVIGLYWLFTRGTSLRKLAWAIVGGGSILIVVAALFVAIGAWNALWQAVFLYNFAHSDASLQDRLDVLWDLSRRMDPVSLLVVAAWCTALYALWRRKLQGEASRGLIVVAAIVFPLEVASLSLSGYSGLGFLHYYLTALLVCAVLLAFLVSLILQQRLANPTFLSAILLFGVLSFSFSQAQFAALTEKYFEEGLFAEDRRSLAGERIQQLTKPGERILVWGYDPRVYLYAERDSSTRFIHQNVVIKPSAINQFVREQFLAEIKADMPALIIDIRHPRFPPLASGDRANWQPVHRYIHDPEIHRPFFDFVEANYALFEVFENYLIYLPKAEETIAQPVDRGELVVNSIFNVYRSDRILTFVKDACSQDDAAKRFILHVIPVDRSVIDGKEEANLDFSFRPADDWQAGNACVVSVELPDYPIAFIRTGQYKTDRSGHDWLEELQLLQAE